MSADLTSLIAKHELIGKSAPAGEHECRFVGPPSECGCQRVVIGCTGCDWTTEADGTQSDAFLEHLAVVIEDSEWLQERLADELYATTDAWTQGQWSDVLLPKPTPPAVPVIAYANRVGDWLRDRAQAIRESRQGC